MSYNNKLNSSKTFWGFDGGLCDLNDDMTDFTKNFNGGDEQRHDFKQVNQAGFEDGENKGVTPKSGVETERKKGVVPDEVNFLSNCYDGYHSDDSDDGVPDPAEVGDPTDYGRSYSSETTKVETESDSTGCRGENNGLGDEETNEAVSKAPLENSCYEDEGEGEDEDDVPAPGDFTSEDFTYCGGPNLEGVSREATNVETKFENNGPGNNGIDPEIEMVDCILAVIENNGSTEVFKNGGCTNDGGPDVYTFGTNGNGRGEGPGPSFCESEFSEVLQESGESKQSDGSSDGKTTKFVAEKPKKPIEDVASYSSLILDKLDVGNFCGAVKDAGKVPFRTDYTKLLNDVLNFLVKRPKDEPNFCGDSLRCYSRVVTKLIEKSSKLYLYHSLYRNLKVFPDKLQFVMQILFAVMYNNDKYRNKLPAVKVKKIEKKGVSFFCFTSADGGMPNGKKAHFSVLADVTGNQDKLLLDDECLQAFGNNK